jgi:hypothetical protein
VAPQLTALLAGEVAAKAAESDDKGEKSDKGDDKRQAKS